MGKNYDYRIRTRKFWLITLDTWEKITSTDKLILRTAIHPTVAELDKRNVVYTACDDFYEKCASFEEVYKQYC